MTAAALLSPFVGLLLGFFRPSTAPLPIPCGLPSADKFPIVPGGNAGKDSGAAALPKRPRIFGVGVGFEKTGTLQGVPLSIVLAGAPASRAGLIPGCVIAEINGNPTVGRTGDDCAQMIRDATSSTVTVRYFDPALKEHVVTLEKEWIEVPQ